MLKQFNSAACEQCNLKWANGTTRGFVTQTTRKCQAQAGLLSLEGVQCCRYVSCGTMNLEVQLYLHLYVATGPHLCTENGIMQITFLAERHAEKSTKEHKSMSIPSFSLVPAAVRANNAYLKGSSDLGFWTSINFASEYTHLLWNSNKALLVSRKAVVNRSQNALTIHAVVTRSYLGDVLRRLSAVPVPYRKRR